MDDNVCRPKEKSGRGKDAAYSPTDLLDSDISSDDSEHKRKFDDIRNSSPVGTSHDSSDDSSSSYEYRWEEAKPAKPPFQPFVTSVNIGEIELPAVKREFYAIIPLKAVLVILFPNNTPDDLELGIKKLDLHRFTKFEADLLTNHVRGLRDSDIQTFTVGDDIYVAEFSRDEVGCSYKSLKAKFAEIMCSLTPVLDSVGKQLEHENIAREDSVPEFRSDCSRIAYPLPVVCSRPRLLNDSVRTRLDDGVRKDSHIANQVESNAVQTSDSDTLCNNQVCLPSSFSKKCVIAHVGEKTHEDQIFKKRKLRKRTSSETSVENVTDDSENQDPSCTKPEGGKSKKVTIVLKHLFPENEEGEDWGMDTDVDVCKDKVANIPVPPKKEDCAILSDVCTTDVQKAAKITDDEMETTDKPVDGQFSDTWESMLSAEIYSATASSEYGTTEETDQESDGNRGVDENNNTTLERNTFIESIGEKAAIGPDAEKIASSSKMPPNVGESLNHAGNRSDNRSLLTNAEEKTSDLRLVVNDLRKGKNSRYAPDSTMIGTENHMALEHNRKTQNDSGPVMPNFTKNNLSPHVIPRVSFKFQSLAKEVDLSSADSAQSLDSTDSMSDESGTQSPGAEWTVTDSYTCCSPENLHQEVAPDCRLSGTIVKELPIENSSGHVKGVIPKKRSVSPSRRRGREVGQMEKLPLSTPMERLDYKVEGRFRGRPSDRTRRASSADSRGRVQPQVTNKCDIPRIKWRPEEMYGGSGLRPIPFGGRRIVQRTARFVPDYSKLRFRYRPELYSPILSSETEFGDVDDDDLNARPVRPKNKVLRRKSSRDDRVSNQRRERETSSARSDASSDKGSNRSNVDRQRMRGQNERAEPFPKFPVRREVSIERDEFKNKLNPLIVNSIVPGLTNEIENLVVGIRMKCERENRFELNELPTKPCRRLDSSSKRTYKPPDSPKRMRSRRRSHSPSCVRTFSPRKGGSGSRPRRRSLTPTSSVPQKESCRSYGSLPTERVKTPRYIIERSMSPGRYGHQRTNDRHRNSQRDSSSTLVEVNDVLTVVQGGNECSSSLSSEIHYSSTQRCHNTQHRNVSHTTNTGACGPNELMHSGYSSPFTPFVQSCKDSKPSSAQFSMRGNSQGAVQVEGTQSAEVANGTIRHYNIVLRPSPPSDDEQVIILKGSELDSSVDDLWPFLSGSSDHESSSMEDSCDGEVEGFMFNKLSRFRRRSVNPLEEVLADEKADSNDSAAKPALEPDYNIVPRVQNTGNASAHEALNTRKSDHHSGSSPHDTPHIGTGIKSKDVSTEPAAVGERAGENTDNKLNNGCVLNVLPADATQAPFSASEDKVEPILKSAGEDKVEPNLKPRDLIGGLAVCDTAVDSPCAYEEVVMQDHDPALDAPNANALPEKNIDGSAIEIPHVTQPSIETGDSEDVIDRGVVDWNSTGKSVAASDPPAVNQNDEAEVLEEVAVEQDGICLGATITIDVERTEKQPAESSMKSKSNTDAKSWKKLLLRKAQNDHAVIGESNATTSTAPATRLVGAVVVTEKNPITDAQNEEWVVLDEKTEFSCSDELLLATTSQRNEKTTEDAAVAISDRAVEDMPPSLKREADSIDGGRKEIVSKESNTCTFEDKSALSEQDSIMNVEDNLPVSQSVLEKCNAVSSMDTTRKKSLLIMQAENCKRKNAKNDDVEKINKAALHSPYLNLQHVAEGAVAKEISATKKIDAIDSDELSPLQKSPESSDLIGNFSAESSTRQSVPNSASTAMAVGNHSKELIQEQNLASTATVANFSDTLGPKLPEISTLSSGNARRTTEEENAAGNPPASGQNKLEKVSGVSAVPADVSPDTSRSKPAGPSSLSSSNIDQSTEEENAPESRRASAENKPEEAPRGSAVPVTVCSDSSRSELSGLSIIAPGNAEQFVNKDVAQRLPVSTKNKPKKAPPLDPAGDKTLSVPTSEPDGNNDEHDVLPAVPSLKITVPTGTTSTVSRSTVLPTSLSASLGFPVLKVTVRTKPSSSTTPVSGNESQPEVPHVDISNRSPELHRIPNTNSSSTSFAGVVRHGDDFRHPPRTKLALGSRTAFGGQSPSFLGKVIQKTAVTDASKANVSLASRSTFRGPQVKHKSSVQKTIETFTERQRSSSLPDQSSLISKRPEFMSSRVSTSAVVSKSPCSTTTISTTVSSSFDTTTFAPAAPITSDISRARSPALVEAPPNPGGVTSAAHRDSRSGRGAHLRGRSSHRNQRATAFPMDDPGSTEVPSHATVLPPAHSQKPLKSILRKPTVTFDAELTPIISPTKQVLLESGTPQKTQPKQTIPESGTPQKTFALKQTIPESGTPQKTLDEQLQDGENVIQSLLPLMKSRRPGPRKKRGSSLKSQTSARGSKSPSRGRGVKRAGGRGRGRPKKRKRLPSISSDEDIIEELSAGTGQKPSKAPKSPSPRESDSSQSERDDSDDDLVSFMDVSAETETSLVEKIEIKSGAHESRAKIIPDDKAEESESHSDDDNPFSDADSESDSEDDLKPLSELAKRMNDSKNTTLPDSKGHSKDDSSEQPVPGNSPCGDHENIFTKMSKEIEAHEDELLAPTMHHPIEQTPVNTILDNGNASESGGIDSKMQESRSPMETDISPTVTDREAQTEVSNTEKESRPASSKITAKSPVARNLFCNSGNDEVQPFILTPPTSPKSDENDPKQKINTECMPSFVGPSILDSQAPPIQEKRDVAPPTEHSNLDSAPIAAIITAKVSQEVPDNKVQHTVEKPSLQQDSTSNPALDPPSVTLCQDELRNQNHATITLTSLANVSTSTPTSSSLNVGGAREIIHKENEATVVQIGSKSDSSTVLTPSPRSVSATEAIPSNRKIVSKNDSNTVLTSPSSNKSTGQEIPSNQKQVAVVQPVSLVAINRTYALNSRDKNEENINTHSELPHNANSVNDSAPRRTTSMSNMPENRTEIDAQPLPTDNHQTTTVQISSAPSAKQSQEIQGNHKNADGISNLIAAAAELAGVTNSENHRNPTAISASVAVPSFEFPLARQQTPAKDLRPFVETSPKPATKQTRQRKERIPFSYLSMPEAESCHGFLEVCMSAPPQRTYALRRVPYVKTTTSNTDVSNTGAQMSYPGYPQNSSSVLPTSSACATYLRLRDVVSLIKVHPEALYSLVTRCEAALYSPNEYTRRLFAVVYDPVCDTDENLAKMTMRHSRGERLQEFLRHMIVLDKFLHSLLPRFYFEALGVESVEVPKYVNVKIFKPIPDINGDVVKIFRRPYEYNSMLQNKDDKIKCTALQRRRFSSHGSNPRKRSHSSDSSGSAKLTPPIPQTGHPVSTSVAAITNRPLYEDPRGFSLEQHPQGFYLSSEAAPFHYTHGHAGRPQYAPRPISNPFFDRRIVLGGPSEVARMNGPSPHTHTSMYSVSHAQRPMMTDSQHLAYVTTLPGTNVIRYTGAQNHHVVVQSSRPMQIAPSFVTPVRPVRAAPPPYSSVAETNRPYLTSGFPPPSRPPVEDIVTASTTSTNAVEEGVAITSIFSLRRENGDVHNPNLDQHDKVQHDPAQNVAPSGHAMMTTKEFLMEIPNILNQKNKEKGETELVRKLRSRNSMLKSGLSENGDVVPEPGTNTESGKLDETHCIQGNTALSGIDILAEAAAKVYAMSGDDEDIHLRQHAERLDPSRHPGTVAGSDSGHLSGVVSKLQSRLKPHDMVKTKRRGKNSSSKRTKFSKGKGGNGEISVETLTR